MTPTHQAARTLLDLSNKEIFNADSTKRNATAAPGMFATKTLPPVNSASKLYPSPQRSNSTITIASLLSSPRDEHPGSSSKYLAPMQSNGHYNEHVRLDKQNEIKREGGIAGLLHTELLGMSLPNPMRIISHSPDIHHGRHRMPSDSQLSRRPIVLPPPNPNMNKIRSSYPGELLNGTKRHQMPQAQSPQDTFRPRRIVVVNSSSQQLEPPAPSHTGLHPAQGINDLSQRYPPVQFTPQQCPPHLRASVENVNARPGVRQVNETRPPTHPAFRHASFTMSEGPLEEALQKRSRILAPLTDPIIPSNPPVSYRNISSDPVCNVSDIAQHLAIKRNEHIQSRPPLYPEIDLQPAKRQHYPSPSYSEASQASQFVRETTRPGYHTETVAQHTPDKKQQTSSLTPDEMGIDALRSAKRKYSDTSDEPNTAAKRQRQDSTMSPVIDDDTFVAEVKIALDRQRKGKKHTFGRRQAARISQVLEQAQPPDDSEALFLTKDEAEALLEPNQFFPGIIVTKDQQPMPLQTTTEFLDEIYDDTAKVYVQDATVEASKRKPAAPRRVTIEQLKQKFAQPHDPNVLPWNCLELATHVEDGLRPAFLSGEDCRLLTKLKHPNDDDKAGRRGYQPGWKEVEKWALLAQGGSLTEPHQDSHGYNTYITVNQGIVGFGFLATPSAEERKEWHNSPHNFTDGRWRYVILRPGHTVYFPSGTVHFVFRLASQGDTLAYGGHVLRCSQIVNWVKTILEEQSSPGVTNEDLSVSAPAYLERVEKFVKQASKDGRVGIWGGEESIREFLALKAEVMKVKKK